MDIYEKRVNTIRELIGENSLKDFATAFNDIDASYLSQILNGHRRLGDRAAINLAKKLDIPVELLITGHCSDFDQKQLAVRWMMNGLKPPLPMSSGLFTGGQEEEEAQSSKTQDRALRKARSARVPVVGKAMLGTDGYFDALDYPAGHGDGYIDIVSGDPDAYGLKVVGSSMHPRIKNGEFVLIEPNHTFQAGDEVLVRTMDGRSMVKEFIYFRDGQFRFDSISNGYPPIFLDVESVEHVHYVAGILKSSKYVEEKY